MNETLECILQAMLECNRETLKLQERMAEVSEASHNASKLVSEMQLVSLKKDAVERERCYAHNEDVRRFDREVWAQERAKRDPIAASPTEEKP